MKKENSLSTRQLVYLSTCRNYPFHGCKDTASATMLQYLKLGFCAKYLKVIIRERKEEQNTFCAIS